MRTLIGLAIVGAALAGGGIALAGPPATNKNGDFIDLSVAVSPPVAGTVAAPQGVAVSFNSFVGNRINGNAEGINTGITVRFNKGFKMNGRYFPSCKLNPTGLSVCPKSTEIGTGTAEASVAGSNGAPPTFIPATLIAYNGKPYKTSAPTLIISALLNGKPTTELDFRGVQQSVGPFGLAIDEIIFPGPPGPFGITKFALNIPDRTTTAKVKGKKVKIHLIDAPDTCSGAWQYEQVNTFSGGEPALTATDSQPCTKG